MWKFSSATTSWKTANGMLLKVRETTVIWPCYKQMHLSPFLRHSVFVFSSARIGYCSCMWHYNLTNSICILSPFRNGLSALSSNAQGVWPTRAPCTMQWWAVINYFLVNYVIKLLWSSWLQKFNYSKVIDNRQAFGFHRAYCQNCSQGTSACQPNSSLFYVKK